MKKLRQKYTDCTSFIDAVEIGKDFVTVYLNTTSPGCEGSKQQEFITLFKEYLENPYLHDPDRFHKGDDPRGSNWRTWEHKFACHFHLLGIPQEILQNLVDRLDHTWLSTTIRENLIQEIQ